MLLADSLLKELLPVALDKVPGQRLPNNVAGDADDSGSGVLFPDQVRVQGVTQVPERAGCRVNDRFQGLQSDDSTENRGWQRNPPSLLHPFHIPSPC